MPILPLILSLLVAACLTATTHAHEHWVVAERAGTGTVQVSVCSGHYFPKSATALADKVLRRVIVTSSGGEAIQLTLATEGKSRSGVYTQTGAGAQRVDFVLQRQRARQPAYEGRTFFLRTNTALSTSLLSSGQGLELVPRGDLAQLRAGSVLPVEVLFDGAPQTGTITHLPEGGKEHFLRTTKGKPAQVTFRKAGRHLLSARVNGRGVSLTIHVPATTEGK